MKKFLTILSFALALGFSASAQEAKPQDPEKHVARVFPMPYEHMYFHSEVLDFDKNFSVLLPKSYAKQPDRKYPVVYMLHGHGENDWEWANIPCQMINEAVTMVTNDGSACEMIIVFPNATEGQSGYNNRDGWKYEDYFFNELMPYVESHYRVIADKGHRAIGGLSMGGGGSFTYGMKHPELFSSVYAISAAVRGDIKMADRPEESAGGIMAQVGYTPEQIEAAKSVNFVLDCGDDDFLFNQNVACYQSMKKEGMKVQFRSYDGAHASYYWYDALRRALVYFTRHFSDQCE